ncbi:MAG: hypothetical protein ABFD92_07685 [Planctomycetaceae bacterium]|nr:hypothetical protein [Planctomycetaceae bacterium]
MLPNREGLFNAYPLDIGITQSGPNNLLTCSILLRLYEELSNGSWIDCSAEGMEITGYFYLEKKDGALNTTAIDSLKASLGWDGRDPFWMQDNAENLREKPVQVKLGAEQYNGKTRIKVQFLNPHGSSAAGVSKGDDVLRRTINTRLGARLRAQAGGTPAPAQTPPPRPAQAPAPAASAAPATATMEQAWAEFCKHCPAPKWDQQAIEGEWFRILGELFPAKQPAELTSADWAVMLAQGPGRIIPF